jgi:hypothetical protein
LKVKELTAQNHHFLLEIFQKHSSKRNRQLTKLMEFTSKFLKIISILFNNSSLIRKYRGKASIVSYFEMRSPKLLVIDPKLIKDISTTYFSHFHDSGFGKFVSIEESNFNQTDFIIYEDQQENGSNFWSKSIHVRRQ